mmetsp:Transcript_24037/g.36537  ORF Transcript_24037/g.36537 Transcript_24037/m.36537 type:complete len:161 (-) Transcript_24037:1332-1814(-)
MVNYPCPGTSGIESFCVDHDPDDNFFKCGCLPGYKPSYPRNYDESLTGVPLEYSPSECVETFLIKHIQLDLMITVPSTINMTHLIEEYKAKKTSLINSLYVSVNDSLTLTAKVKAIDIMATQSGKIYNADMLSLLIKATLRDVLFVQSAHIPRIKLFALY